MSSNQEPLEEATLVNQRQQVEQQVEQAAVQTVEQFVEQAPVVEGMFTTLLIVTQSLIYKKL
jgi:hypothetical protein